MKNQTIAVIISLLSALTLFAHAEILPDWPVDYSILQSDLIIEGVVKDGKTVAITKVYFGSAKIGDEIPVDRLSDLPSVAYDELTWDRQDSDKGIPTKSETAVLFLVREKDQTAYQPFGWGSGVKWLLNQKVYGYTQMINPGPYQLIPDLSTPTIENLRLAITNGLKKRKEFQDVLLEKNPDTRAQKLSHYVQPTESYHYFSKAVAELQILGHSGALVFSRELVRPEQEKHRRDFIIAIGRTKDKESTPFLMTIMDNAKPVVIDTVGAFDGSKASKKEQLAMSDWQTAIYAAAEIGDARSLAYFREAALWGAKHRDQEMVESAVSGMRTSPIEMNLPTFQNIFDALPRETDGFGKFAAYFTLLSLIEHKFHDAIPILASQLDHPDDYNQRQAHRGLVGIVGEDLGRKKEPWLEWYSKNKMKQKDR